MQTATYWILQLRWQKTISLHTPRINNNHAHQPHSQEKLNRIYTISCKIAGFCTPAPPVWSNDTSQIAKKMLSDPSHFVHDQYDLLPSERRYRMPTVRAQRAAKSFTSSSIKCMNQPQKIYRWPTYHSPHRCHRDVVLSYLFIWLITLSYCFSIVIPSFDNNIFFCWSGRAKFYLIDMSTTKSYRLHIYIFDFTVQIQYYAIYILRLIFYYIIF